MPDLHLDLMTFRMLLFDWFARLARESGLEFSQHGAGERAFNLDPPNAFHITAHFIERPPSLEFVASDGNRQSLVDSIAARAASSVQGNGFGGTVWYSTELREVPIALSSISLIAPLLERLGSQIRITGWRRLGPSIMLEFAEELAEGQAESILAPKALVHVHIAAPGPCAGVFSSHVAHRVAETVGAVCTFALGRPVELPFTIFPAKEETFPELDRRKVDHEILTLARQGISLDIFSQLGVDGGFDCFQRARGALITFDAATRQARDSVAAILYVAAAESLATPNATWGRERLTKRFKEFFEELMPGELDRIVSHKNFEEAFGIRRGDRTARALRRELLDRVYDYRSGQLHEGLEPSYRGLGIIVEEGREARRGLLRDFAEAAILRFLAAPRSSLTGHPAYR